MHSNIYGLVKLQEPKAIEVEPFNENSIEFDDVSYFADYFKDSENDFESEVKWLTDFLDLDQEDIIKDNGVIILKLTKNKVKDYLQRKYDRFTEKVEYLTLDDFINDPYTLKECVEDEYGFHIYQDNESMFNLDDFMRSLYRWTLRKQDVVYFQVNGILDYHF